MDDQTHIEFRLGDLHDLVPSLGSLDFVQDREIYKESKPYQVNGLLPPDQEHLRTNLMFETHRDIPIYDVRPYMESLSLDIHGFEFAKCPELASIEVRSEAQVEAYLQEVVAYLKSKFAAELVVVYAFNLRDSSISSAKKGRDQYASDYLKAEVAIPDVHTDATKDGGPRRIRKHLTAEEAEKYLNNDNWRLRIVNLWRPTCKVVEKDALAFCDTASMSFADLLATDRPSQDYLGECYFVKYSPQHRFYWLKHQTSAEMSIFTSFDSHSKRSIPYVPHVSFCDPKADPSCQPRTSIEVRAIVVSTVKEN